MFTIWKVWSNIYEVNNVSEIIYLIQIVMNFLLVFSANIIGGA